MKTVITVVKCALLFVALVVSAMADQVIVIVSGSYATPPDVSQVERLIQRGWRIVSVAGGGGSNFHFVFVLEAPKK
jgi:hypothetical protein